MTKFADLLQKPAPKEVEENQGVAESVATTEIEIPKLEENWSLDDSTEQTFAEEPKPTNPMAVLKNSLAGLKKPTPNIASLPIPTCRPNLIVIDDPIVESKKQFQNPTMTDVSNYVFEEQPDESTQEITAKFDGLLSDLVNAVGVDIPNLLAQNLNFIKEHPFLAEILKPESIDHLCNAMRKSYGHVVQAKAERTKKATVRGVKEQSVLDSMSELTF